MNTEKLLATARSVLEIESSSIELAKGALNENFASAAQKIIECKGKVVLSGMGKSGLIARKLASTMSSTGTASVFLHPAEAAHGDLGLLAAQDILIAFSQSGRSSELNIVLAHAARLGIPVIGFTGNLSSQLAEASFAVIDTSVRREACPLGLAPTASSSVALALGDALAMAISEAKGFNEDNFKDLHPAGGLGQKLLKVKDLMHSGDSLPLLGIETPLKDILVTMSRGDVRGACGIVGENKELLGIITDGDIRRRLEQGQDPMQSNAKEVMTKNPRTIDQEELAERALFVMEEFRISVLFVLSRHSKTPVGVLHIQDLLKAKVK